VSCDTNVSRVRGSLAGRARPLMDPLVVSLAVPLVVSLVDPLVVSLAVPLVISLAVLLAGR